MGMTTFHVSPRGDDCASGSTKSPFATLGRAIEAARQITARRPRRIVMAGGSYFDVTVELSARDSGLTIEAATGATPTLYGGRRVTGWKRDGARFYAAHLPGVNEGRWDFRSLIVGGRYCPRARFPHEGKLTHESRFKVRWMSTTKGGWERKPTTRELTTMRIKPGDLPRTVEPRNLELAVYHSWDESVVGVRSIDHRTGLIRFNTPAGHPPGAFCGWKDQCCQYVAWNIREGMLEPGQWYLDRERGCVVYWPLKGERMERVCVVAPTTERVIRLEGTEKAPVRDVVLRGLTISATTTPLTAGGFGALKFDGAVSGDSTRDCRLEGLRVVNVGGQGIKIRQSRSLVCTGCEIAQTGAGGVVFSGTACRMENNHIHHDGLTYPSGIALRCDGNDHRINHNTFHHTTYSAIAGGGRRIVIEYNCFHHIMEALVDGAAIYLFAAKQCTLRGNYTHSVREEQVHAYYLDEQSADSLVEGNLAVDVPWPIHNHMATNCRLRGNVCVSRAPMTISFMNCHGFVLERNLFSTPAKLTIDSSYTGLAKLSRNVFHSGSGQMEYRLHDRLPSLERNAVPVPPVPRNEDSVIADPLFVNAEKGDLRFRRGSPAARRGIKVPDARRAGVRRR